MSDITTNYRRIAKNTLVLYIRMFVTTLVSLYTSRVVLNALGVDDYGIYNVVGGFVSMFSVLSGSLSAAISRYITFELGKKNTNRLGEIFSTAIHIQVLISIIIIIAVEVIGVWFLNTQMQIEPERLGAANWVLQLSVLTFCANLISVPYNALIVAHEKMSAFAYISIFEAAGKLAVAFCILYNPFDRLVFYAFLSCLLTVVIRFIYHVYCRRHFEESRYRWCFDKGLLKEMFGFAGWNFLGSSSGLLANHGVNMLMNIFFGVVANASRGVANQADHAVKTFISNFMMALNPQITKSFASGDLKTMHKLMCMGTKFSYFIMFLLALPLLLETPIVLQIWLKTVPDYAIIFLRWTLIVSLTYVLSNALVTGMLATGNIKKYQIVISSLSYTILPIVFILYKMGLPPHYSYIVVFVIYFIQLFVRLFLLRDMVKLPISQYVNDVFIKVIIVTGLSLIIPLSIILLFPSGYIRFVIVTLCSLISVASTSLFIGLTSSERNVVFISIKKFKSKIFK